MKSLSLFALALALALVACTPAPAALTPEALRVGVRAPDIDAETIVPAGARADLASLRGRVVILDFWATYCDPCKRSLTELQKLATRYASRDLEAITFSEDDREEAQDIAPFAAAYAGALPVVWDADHKISVDYRVGAFPTTVVIDRTGVIRYSHTGFSQKEVDALAKLVGELLASK